MGKFHLKELQCNERFNIIGFIDLFVDSIEGLTKFNSVKEAKEAGAFTAIVAGQILNTIMKLLMIA